MRTLVFLTQFFDCIDGVRGWFALQFAIVHLKLRFAFDRAAQHLQTRFRCRYRIVFMRGKARRYKNDSFERESLQSEARQNQVGLMHRIESAAETADHLKRSKESVGCARPCTGLRRP